MTIPVGLSVWSGLVARTMPYLDQVAGPFDSLWFPDHVQYADAPVAEGWSLLAFGLGRYPDKLCGHSVLCNSFRNPALLAKMAATCQHLSGGRVVLGIGAGWNEEEYRAYGWPFPRMSVRAAQLDEAIRLIRAMWAGRPADFTGQHYTIAGAYCEPPPSPTPPIMVGGKGERFTLRVVAEQADWWNYIYQDRAEYAHKQAVLRQHCEAVGRPYEAITQVLACQLLLGESEAEVRRLQERPDVRSVSANGLAGTPRQIADQLLAAIDQGAGRLVLGFADSPRTYGAELFAAVVLPLL
jgi:alkanesulfonate monooxygenase SsuD/methylene tetrahydromethanopterin reductase-like flavin-dependent oxidoreductase (luciferase family)